LASGVNTSSIGRRTQRVEKLPRQSSIAVYEHSF